MVSVIGLIGRNEERHEIMMYATQYRESDPYYRHDKIGYKYMISDIWVGIGRGSLQAYLLEELVR